MGPRFFDRGNANYLGSEIDNLVLQWGRGSLTAETKALSEIPTFNTKLQWGRGSLTAETGWGLHDAIGLEYGFNGAAVL